MSLRYYVLKAILNKYVLRLHLKKVYICNRANVSNCKARSPYSLYLDLGTSKISCLK